MKIERIIEQLKENKSVKKIAENEKISRHSISLVKQTIQILEEKHNKEMQQIRKELEEKEKKIKQCVEAYNKLKKEQEKSLLKCIYEYKYEFLYTLIAYNVILLVIIAVAKKFLGG